MDPTPTRSPDGVLGPVPGLRTDLGPAPEEGGLRALIAFHLRDAAGLDQAIRDIYTPGHPRFRRYMTPQEWTAQYAPTEADLKVVSDWFDAQGLKVTRVATNRMLVQVTGTVGQFNRAFGVTLRLLERNSQQYNEPHRVYGVTEPLQAPRFVVERIAGIVSADLAVEGTLPPEATTPPTPTPEDLSIALTPAQLRRNYNVDALHARGFRGQGVKLGISVGGEFRRQDMADFWRMFGITRAQPRVVHTMEQPVTRLREVALNTQWAGAMAPEAEIILYMGPDARTSSSVYTFNEAIARGEVSVLSTSFSHREDGEPRVVRETYGRVATMAAALGITVVAAGGNTAGVNTPSGAPYVTSVGGTELVMDGLTRVSEVAWTNSGSGLSNTFPTPWWQEGLTPPVFSGSPEGLQGRRAAADLALNAGTEYWHVFINRTFHDTGTSYATPAFAGMLACINSARAAEGKPPVGWLNQQLYTLPDVQAAFRDITGGQTWDCTRDYSTCTPKHPAGPGWDFPTGWGAPDVEALHDALP
jgi:kumamolisin